MRKMFFFEILYEYLYRTQADKANSSLNEMILRSTRHRLRGR